MKASDLFVRCLEAEGVTRIFGVPGEENADLMISLQDSDIDFVLCRHEQAAAFMADAHGRLTGEPGVCLGTLGPGATNLVTGVADANMDRAPLVAIIGQASTARLHKESHQNMDAIGMYRPITKWSQGIYEPEVIPEIVRKAFRIAKTEKPGACVIELPENIAHMQCDSQPMPATRLRRPAADHKSVKHAVDLIAGAKSPLILAGNGAIRKRAARQLRRLAHKTGIGVVNTFMGKGCLPLDDPHCLFTIGLQGRDHIIQAFEEADLVVTVGYDLVEYAPQSWNGGTKKTLIHIDFEPPESDSDYPVELAVVSDIADALWQINEGLNARFEDKLPLYDIATRAELRRRILEDLTAEENDDAFPIKPQRLILDLRKFLGEDDILLSDVGAHKMWVARYYNCYQPNTCLISNGFCSMGFALPGAIGAKMAFPERQVAALLGHGGFLMNLQDLETAARRGIKIICVIWEDGEYGLIKWKQQDEFEGRHSDLTFNNPDIEQLAAAFDVWGRRVDSAADFRIALSEAAEQDKPALIAVQVDYGENRKLTERLGNLICKI